jgi:hypothetical protein
VQLLHLVILVKSKGLVCCTYVFASYYNKGANKKIIKEKFAVIKELFSKLFVSKPIGKTKGAYAILELVLLVTLKAVYISNN